MIVRSAFLNDDVHPTSNDFDAYLSSAVYSTANIDGLSCGSTFISVPPATSVESERLGDCN